uniref:VWFA domain-containing protein n=1 Tax=Plectus sambesii TaxID=2011161 RepID=A0A914VEB5_9BILA
MTRQIHCVLFQTLKVLSDIVDRFNIENGDTRVAAISCGGSASLKFNFTAYTKRSQCKDALTALTYTGGAPNFGQALNLTLSTLQSTGRSDAKKVVIIVSADE